MSINISSRPMWQKVIGAVLAAVLIIIATVLVTNYVHQVNEEKAAQQQQEPAQDDPADVTDGEDTQQATPVAAPAPSADALRKAVNEDIYRTLAQLKSQVEGVDYRFEIDPNWAASVDPGRGEFGAPVFSEAELVSTLANGSERSELAIKVLQDKMLTENGLTISRQNQLKASSYKCAQNLKENKSNNMAYIEIDGSVKWGDKLEDPAGSVNCMYVGPEVAAALAAGKQLVAVGYRGNCLNPQEMPVTIVTVPTRERITPHAAQPPIKTVVNVPPTVVNVPPKVVVPPVAPKDVLRCDVTIKKVVPVSEEVAKDTDRYKPVGDIACQPVHAKDPSLDPALNGNAPDNGALMPDPGPATPPAVPETDAPDVVTIPDPPAPAPTTPRQPEEIPTNEGAPPTTPVTGIADETVCEYCGDGMSETTQAASVPVQAPVAAEAVTVAAAPAVAAPVAVEAPVVAAPVMVAPAAPVAAEAPVVAAPAPPVPTEAPADVVTQVASVDSTVAAPSVATEVG